MTRPGRNPRRAYDHEGREIPPMTLASMRARGVTHVFAACEAHGCRHEGTVDVSSLPDELPVPDVALKMRCSAWAARKPGVTRVCAIVAPQREHSVQAYEC